MIVTLMWCCEKGNWGAGQCCYGVVKSGYGMRCLWQSLIMHRRIFLGVYSNFQYIISTCIISGSLSYARGRLS